MKIEYQLVKWFPSWQGFTFIRQTQNSDMRYIYDWYLFFAFWELRKWHTLTEAEKEVLKVNEIKNELGYTYLKTIERINNGK